MHTRHLAAACAAALALGGGAWGSATAAPHHAVAKGKPTVATVAKKLTMPLSVAQAPDGTRYWTDRTGLWKQPVGGVAAPLFASTRKAPVEAVSADGGVLRFATGSTNNKAGNVWTLGTTGTPTLIADTFAYEKSANPDGKFDYGFLRTPKSCLAQLPKDVPPAYPGSVESHPYATAYAGGVTYVADAGGNDIIAVSATGVVSTVAVLKPVKVKITAAGAKANKLPACTVGRKYALEGVPTDVEVGPDGWLYVTSLPGGPEDGSLGANGRVLRIDPATGRTTTLADGLLSPTGVAVTANGDVYVTELFAGVVAKIRHGSSKVRTYAEAPFPAAIEATPTGLLATINAIPIGKKPKGAVVTMTP
jgi:hypothetical protein